MAAGAIGAAVYWPARVEDRFPGWIQNTASIRALLPGAAANLPAKTTAAALPAQGRAPVVDRPPAPVKTEIVQRGPMPLRVDAVGQAQPISTVNIRSRVDAQIDKIFVADGAIVKAGDTLVKLDSRQIEAQMRQTEASIAKDQTVIEQTTRDMGRAAELFGKGAGPQLNLDNAKTAGIAAKAQLAADTAALENLKVQLSWYTLTSPMEGRVGTFTAKAGNIIRTADNAATGVLATIVQTEPIYVAFSVPQVSLAPLREAVDQGGGEVVATPQGGKKSSTGKIAVLDNAIDPTTGTITIRAVFNNADETLWPGQLCNVRVTLRTDPDLVSVPRTATQAGQIGSYVYVVEDNVARLRKVKVGRFQDGRDVIIDGLKGGETVVSVGALLLADGSRVVVQNDKGQDQSKKEGI